MFAGMTDQAGQVGIERIKLVYHDESAGTGRVERLDDAGRVITALDMSLIAASVPCFTPNASVATKTGLRLVDDLRAGDQVVTRDHGPCEITWIGKRSFGWRDLGTNPLLRPVRIRAGALGQGLPERDLIVSPNHRMLVAPHTEAAGGESEALVTARDLVGRPGVEVLQAMSVTYFQVLFARHEIILAEGCWSESFLPEKASLAAMDAESLTKLGRIHPEVLEGQLPSYALARNVIAKGQVSTLNP
jgi:hypothetical protein